MESRDSLERIADALEGIEDTLRDISMSLNKLESLEDCIVWGEVKGLRIYGTVQQI